MPNVFLSSQFASTTAGAQHHSHQKKFDSTAMVVPMQGTEKYVIFQSLNSSDHKQCSLVIGRDARAVYNGGLYSSDQFDLTPENVDKVLEDVLPYLIADSGNVDAKCLSRTMPFLSSFKILSYRERDRERAQARAGHKPKHPKGDGLTPEQRRERDAKALQEKAARKAAAGGNNANNKK
nr:putative SERF-like protein [Ipomoea batatas]